MNMDRGRLRILDADTRHAWREMFIAWDDCDRCPLSKSRGQVVHGRGELPADILFLGEGPGYSEDMLGYPFMGAAGNIFNRMLAASSLRSLGMSYFVCNTVGCRPTERRNGRDHNRPPTDDEQRSCRGRVDALFGMAKPAAVVALGKTADLWMRRYGTAAIETLVLPHPSRIGRECDPKAPERSLPFQRWVSTLDAFLVSVDLDARAQHGR